MISPKKNAAPTGSGTNASRWMRSTTVCITFSRRDREERSIPFTFLLFFVKQKLKTDGHSVSPNVPVLC